MTAIAERGPVALLHDLEAEGKLTLQALVLTEEISFDRFEALCRYVGTIHDSSNWWIGDLLVYGERMYGEEVHQAIEATGKSPDMIMRCVVTATRIPPGRRHANLSWSHHREVAYLEPDDQDKWLEEAEGNGWTRRQMAEHIRPVPELPERVPCPQCNGRGWLDELPDA